MSPEPDYEYAVLFARYPEAIHRGPFTKGEAESWINEWIEDGGKPEVMSIVRRLVSEWEPLPDEEVDPVSKPQQWCVRRVTVGVGYDAVGESSLNDLLRNGWEPYAVTPWNRDVGSGFTHHLRRFS